MTGYDRKTLSLSHASAGLVTFEIQIDIDGCGHWKTYRSVVVPPGETFSHVFPEAFAAYWIRLIGSSDTTATAWLVYE